MAPRGKAPDTLSRLAGQEGADEMPAPVEKRVFADAMSRVAASVWVVTAGREEARAGRTATSVMALTAEPPRLVASISAASPLAQAIVAENGFSLALLAVDQGAVGDAFAGHIPPGERFRSDAWEVWPSGRPRLRGAVLALDCTLAGVVDTGANTLFIGTLIATRTRDADPLLWHRRAYRELAPVPRENKMP